MRQPLLTNRHDLLTRRVWSSPLLVTLGLLALTACESSTATETKAGTVYADAVRVGDGTARTYLTRDPRGVPTSLGVELSESALGGLPSTPLMLHLPLPKEAASTQYSFVMFDWNPQGHEPEHVYTFPHFDFHFYMAEEGAVMKIPGGPEPVVPDARFVPADYISPGNVAVPAMGVHWVDQTAGELNGKPFDQTLIYGFDRGEMLFIEPMITKAYLETRPNFSAPVKQPQAVQRAGLYPLRYSIRYDANDRVLRISLDDLARR